MKRKSISAALALSLAAASLSVPQMVSAGEFEEVTIDIFMDSAGENPITAGIQDDPVAQMIREETGVILNVIPTNSDKEAAMAASGDLYDLNRMQLNHIVPLIQSGAVADMTDYLSEAPYLVENFSGMLNYSEKYMSDGTDGLYAFLFRSKSEAAPLATSRYGTFISWKAYKEAGCPELNSLDDLLDLLKTIQDAHPTTESGKKVYGLSRFNDWGLTWALSESVIWKYYAQYGINSMCCFDIETLEYQDLYNENNIYWETAEFYHKANLMGLLDPETFIQKNENYTQKINEGQIIYTSMEWDWDATNAELAAAGGTDKYVDIPFADTEEFPAWISRASEFGMSGRTFVVSSKCDDTKKAAIMRLINFLFSEDGARSVMIGPKGVTWDYDENGAAVFTEETLAALAENPSYLLEQGAKKYYGIVGQDYDAIALSGENEGRYIDLTLNSDYISANMTPAEKEYSEYYNASTPLEVSTNREHQTTIHEGYLNLMPAENPTRIDRAVTQIEDYLLQAIPEMILTETQEEYDAKYAEIQEELKNLGYDEVTEYYRESWEHAIEEYNALMN